MSWRHDKVQRMSPQQLQRIQPYLDKPLEDLAQLLDNWWTEFQARSAELEFADRPLARKLHAAAEQALQRQPSRPELLQAAILYLCECEDEEHDHSPLGMEDDAEVWNEVCAELGWPDLQV